MSSRDNFPVQTKNTLAKRVGWKCSNPACLKPTSGPHSDQNRSVNLGVACHITAAAIGGPRYDGNLSASERANILNGVWLCQTCAKLIDSDERRYSKELLSEWKRDAEFRADSALMDHVSEYLPQPPSALHAPIPRIAGLTYHAARTRLLEAGWQPSMRHSSHARDPNVQCGNGFTFWEMGYWEIINAWPTGFAQCTFAFHDAYGNLLTIMTWGQEEPKTDSQAHVKNWFFDQSY